MQWLAVFRPLRLARFPAVACAPTCVVHSEAHHRLQRPEVVPPADMQFKQKRFATGSPSVDDVSCVGWDGTPIDSRDEEVGDWSAEEQQEEYREFLKGRKPSPLSEVEFEDTRKPVMRVWDNAAMKVEDNVGLMVEDTVDDSLERAEAMFRAAKERGDPDAPWARALARLRGGPGANVVQEK